jgi:CheY-like chemotaxis protein
MATDGIGKHVLLVEDDPSVREAVGQILERAGYGVLTAANGQEELARLNAGYRPGMILLDLSMPEMDGGQFRRAQSMDARLAAIPVVVFSGEHDLARQAAALRLAGFLEKPVECQKLLRTVRRLCA